MNTNIIKT